MRALALMTLSVGLLAGGDDPKPEDVKKDLDTFQGTWTIVTLERDGVNLLQQFGTFEMVVKGDEYTAPNIAATFKLDPSKSPKAIDISYKEGPAAGQTIKAIYKLEGDNLTMCRARAQGDERPVEFAAPSGSGRMLFAFKRAKPAGDAK